jgi:hypothetical protein
MFNRPVIIQVDSEVINRNCILVEIYIHIPSLLKTQKTSRKMGRFRYWLPNFPPAASEQESDQIQVVGSLPHYDKLFNN